MFKWLGCVIREIGELIVYILHNLKSVKMLVMIYFLYIMGKSIDKGAPLEVLVPAVMTVVMIVFRYKEKKDNKPFIGGTDVNP